ncbi:MAG: aminopeptidase P family protein [Deltaproteobacteria bacterium]|nr:aminopeptidase P family protein [Deltaproteobacteria bacterium]
MNSSEMKPLYRERLKRLRSSMAGKKLGAFVVTDLKNIRYLTGFTGSSAYAIVSSDKAFFLTDPRYTAQSREEVKGFRVKIFKKALDTVAEILGGIKAAAVGFESGSVSFDNYSKLAKALKGKAKLKASAGLVSALRSVKDQFEIEKITEAAKLLDKGFIHALKVVKPGAIEREAAFSIETFWKKRGAEGLAFDTIIASGERGALPHGKASEKRIKKGELVVIDMGALLNGYNSDETRTFVTGRPTAKQKEVYQVVRDAQAAAIESIRPGVKASAVDLAARSVIGKAGYGKYFGHGTGHGVGLDIHESPGLGPTSIDVLEEGMVITVEPGIYIPGWGGVRIEDMALVTKNGAKLLTSTNRDLVIL